MTAAQLQEYSWSWTGLEPAEYFQQQGIVLASDPDPTHDHEEVHVKAAPGLAGTKLQGGKL